MSKTILITGASAGIGKELAQIHAEKGGDLVIVARSKNKLEQLRNELEAKYSVKVGIIDDNTTEDERETIPELTPGFEIVFGLLALFIAIPLIRKSR